MSESEKFGRQYLLKIDGKSGTKYEARLPLTVEFYVRRNVLASANSISLRIYNLKKEVREDIDKACYEYTDVRYIDFQAGYIPPLSSLFYGNIVECKSYRAEGTTNVITEITALDGGYAMSTANSNISKEPITKDEVISHLMDDMTNYGIKRGKKSIFQGEHPRGRSLLGNTWDLLRQESDESCFIDLGTVHVLKNAYINADKVTSDCIQGSILEINSNTGLLGSPRRADMKIMAEILFEPRIIIGQKISMRSNVNSSFDGIFKVISVEHHGTISGSVNGKCKTTFTYLMSGALDII